MDIFPQKEGGRGTNGWLDTPEQSVAVSDDALVAVDFEQTRIRRADFPSQHGSTATSVSIAGATTTAAAAAAATAPSQRTDCTPVLLLRACCCRGRGRRGERFDELAFLLAALEPCHELEALEKREVRDGAIAEGLGLADVVGDGVLAVQPREEDGAEVDGRAVGLVEAGGGGEEVGLQGGMGEEEVGGGGEGDGGGGARVGGERRVGETRGGGGGDGEAEEGERVCGGGVGHCWGGGRGRRRGRERSLAVKSR